MHKKLTSVSVIITVLNEADSIVGLVESLVNQTYLPAEVIIVDGGSSDETIKLLKQCKKDFLNFPLIILEKKGNRSIGRNFAIQKSTTDLIAITDAGCLPQKDWLKELVKKYEETHAPVIAGYYQGQATTPFEAAVIPYVLVMPDKINEDTFLPATRSVLLEKKVWKTLGGFDENLSDNEDYEFAIRIKKSGFKIVFAGKAQVLWMPRSTLQQFFWMIFRFARGDIQSGVVRPKVMVLFLRYLLLLFCIACICMWFNLSFLFSFLLITGGIYSVWAIQKNYRYAQNAWYWLPILQYTGDIGVLLGSIAGLLKR